MENNKLLIRDLAWTKILLFRQSTKTCYFEERHKLLKNLLKALQTIKRYSRLW